MKDLNSLMDQGSVLMAADRPDIWTVDGARNFLEDAVATILEATLRDPERSVAGSPLDVSSGGWQLTRRRTDLGDAEWSLVRKVFDFSTWNEVDLSEYHNSEDDFYDWTKHSVAFSSIK